LGECTTTASFIASRKCSSGLGLRLSYHLWQSATLTNAADEYNIGNRQATPEEEFYFKDPGEGGIFKPTTEDKLKALLSLYILQCAEQLTDTTPKLTHL
jgi:hypothetical protein